MSRKRFCGLILGLCLMQSAFAKPEFYVDGFFSANAAVVDVDPVMAAILNTNTLPILAVSGAQPSFNNTISRPEIFTYNSKPDFQRGSLVGVQGSMDFTDKFGFMVQAVARGSENWVPMVEWAFLKYQLDEDWTIKGGRFRAPFFIYSETVEVGYTYPWSHAPYEVYGLVQNNNYSGVDLSFNKMIYHQSVDMSLYYGSLTANINYFGQNPTVRFRQGIGGNIEIGNNVYKVRAGYNEANIQALPPVVVAQAIQQYALLFNHDAFSLFDINSVKAYFASLGATLNYDDLVFIAEWQKHGQNTPVIPTQRSYYATLGYRFGKVMPYVTFAKLTTTEKSSRVFSGTFGTRVNQILGSFNEDQQTYSLGVRCDVFTDTAIKLQVDRISALHGTNGLFNVKPGEDALLFNAVINMVF